MEERFSELEDRGRRNLLIGAYTVMVLTVFFTIVDFLEKRSLFGRMLGFHLGVLGIGLAVLVFLRYWPRLKEWRMLAIGLIAVLIAMGTVQSVISDEIDVRFAALTLFVMGAAVLVPWGLGYQLALSAIAVISLGVDALMVSPEKNHLYYWVGLLGAIVIGGLAANQLESDRRRTARQILRLQRFASIVGECEEAIVSARVDGFVEEANPAAQNLFAPRGLRTLTDLGITRAQLDEVNQRGSSKLELLLEQGSKTRFLEGSAIIVSRGRAEPGIEVVLHDTTVARQAEQARRKIEEMLVHDFKSPLTVISGYADLLKRNGAPAITTRAANAVSSSAISLRHMVDNFLLVSRLEAGQSLPDERVPCSLNAIVRRVADLFDAVVISSNHTLEIRLSSREPWISADPAEIERAVANLLSNALKYSPEATQVEIEVDAGANLALVRVIDQGRGIPEAARRKLFERYQRDTSHSDSTGLGLFIVRTVVQDHGGLVEVSSSPKGTTFTISFPMISPPNTAKQGAPA